MSAATPSQILGMVYADLCAWCAANGGACALSQNLYDLTEALRNVPTGWRLTVHWEGDRAADERVREGGVVLNSLLLVLDGDLGPTMSPRVGLVQPVAGRPAFLSLVQRVRERVMAYRMPWLREPTNGFWYRGCDDKIALPGDLYAAAYNLRFEVYSQMTIPTERVDLVLPTEA